MSVLLKRIKNVLKVNSANGSTSKQVMNKVISYYPEYLLKKICHFNNGKKALDQIGAEVSSELSTAAKKGILSVDKNKKLYVYKLNK